MLGNFLELALVTADTGGAWQRYQRLGFEAASTGDIWSHDYGVVACQGVAIGLHARGAEPLSLVFVRPEVHALHRELADIGVEVEQARLGSDAFNELVLREPGGVALRILEARTFSPPLALPARTLLGSFLTLSLPCRDPAAATRFWQSLGSECVAVDSPLEGLAIPGTPLACHLRRDFAEPALIFRQHAPPDEAALEAAGFTAQPLPPSLRGQPHLLMRSAEDLAVLIAL
jgi:hypothetical protein